MSLKIGDKVKFLNDVGEGSITKIEGEKVAFVKVEEGFEIPYMISELLPVAEAKEEYTVKAGDTIEAEGKPEEDHDTDDAEEEFLVSDDGDEEEEDGSAGEVNLMLAIVHDNPNDVFNSPVNIYLINDSKYYIFYSISEGTQDLRKCIEAGRLEPEVKLFITSCTQKEIEKEKRVFFEFLFFKKGKYYSRAPSEEYVSLNKTLLHPDNFEEDNEYFDTPAFFIPLTESILKEKMEKLSAEKVQDIIAEKEGIKDKKVKKEAKPDIEEVDLHIQEITDNYQQLTNGEILQMQMDRFQTSLEGAIIHNVKKIVFIHGVGNGKLKYELRKTLDNKYPDLQYQDASFKEYGFGATMVLIQ